MPRVRVAHLAGPIRPGFPNHRVPIRHQHPVPIHHQYPGPMHRPPPPMAARNRLPEYLPVLQPPIFPREYELYEEDEDPYEEIYYPTVVIPDQYGIMTKQFSNRTRAYMLSQNYPRPQSTRYNRHVKLNYPFYIY